MSGYDALFEKGHSFADGKVIEVRDAGTVALPTGRILICDPSDGSTAELLAGAVPTGTHVATVSVVRRSSGGSTIDTIAALRIEFSREPIVRWDAVYFAGVDPAKLPICQASIESNTICVLDASQKPKLDEKLWERIIADLAAFSESGWQVASVALAGGGGVAVSPAHDLTGVTSHWGIDARERRAALVLHIDETFGRDK